MKYLLPTILWLSLLCACLPLSAQQSQTDSLYAHGNELMKARNYKQAVEVWKQYLAKAQPVIDSARVGAAYSKLGGSYYNLYENDSAVKYLNRALVENAKYYPVEDTIHLREHVILGYLNRYVLKQVSRALKHYEAERKIIENYPEVISESQRYANFYNLATSNRYLRDYDRALNYAYRALDIAQTNPDARPSDKSNCYAVIANALNNKNQRQTALKYYELKIQENIKVNGDRSPTLALDYYNLADNYIGRNLPGEAIQILNKALKLVGTSNNTTNLKANILRQLGMSYRILNELATSDKYLEQSLALSPSGSPEKALTYSEMALNEERRMNFEEAQRCYQKGLEAIIPGYQWNELDDMPNAVAMQGNPVAFDLLFNKALGWYIAYQNTKKEEYLINAFQNFNRVDELTELYRQSFVLESSRLHFQKSRHTNYQKAMGIVFDLYNQTRDTSLVASAWQLIEKNKSLLLLQNIILAERSIDLGIPDSVQQLMIRDTKALQAAQKNLNACQLNQGCEQAEEIALRQAISASDESLRKHQQAMAENSPEYFSFTSNSEISQVEDLQASLNPSELLINYFETDDHLYYIALSNGIALFDRIETDSSFNSSLQTFLTEISGVTLASQGIGESLKIYGENAHKLYNRLFANIPDIQTYREITVIPDGGVSGVPFGALVATDPAGARGFNQLDYLVKSIRFNYGFSATLWFKNKTSEPAYSNMDLVAFGNSNANEAAGMARLSAVTNEMNALSGIAGSRLFQDNYSTPSNFRKEAENADLIHLALHNINDYDNPLNSRLIFAPDSTDSKEGFYLYEVFNTPMKPKLVVLSGCETGVGKWEQGEGSYHMGRAFLYHGNPALVMSLWRVNDASTASLMESFYDSIGESGSSANAIRQAKLNYISSADEITAHPRNWAAFISIGDLKLTQKKTDTLTIVVFVSVLLVGMLLVQIGSRKRSANSTP